ncbi:MAG: hypothetical protein ACQES7_04435 [Pseudomonadota bacterium]
MQNKYKVNMLRANLLAAAVGLALLMPASTLDSLVVIWLAVGWLFFTALLLDFSHRRTTKVPWQLIPGILIAALLATMPENNGMLIWAWIAIFMLPQSNWVVMLNALLAIISLFMLSPYLPAPDQWLMFAALVMMCVLSVAHARQLNTINSTIRRRARLIPGMNIWAKEQLARDLPREHTRCMREGIHAELIVFKVRRHQLWPTAHQLCQLTYHFENTYRLNSRMLATLILSRSASEGLERRQHLIQATPESSVCHCIEVSNVDITELNLDTLLKDKRALSPLESL